MGQQTSGASEHALLGTLGRDRAYGRIAADITDQILSGTLPEGQRAPSASELASAYGVSVTTAQKGIDLLRTRAMVLTRPGRGTYVLEGSREREARRRREAFPGAYVLPALREAARLGISKRGHRPTRQERSDPAAPMTASNEHQARTRPAL
ncbi:GntR family transcriptional regulator [Microbacterium marinilacus]|uniref:HTH gntR-type domain-containing protein n=1 Tax=Microbacterium marinilacus TaxID=415209 RepID=A0ABP7BQD4_9MICO|nr:winged helix-turn-helix domain-containing protein [Microbacterium marinilacus]MBY0690476.1 winged helix-turn-helix domain-containing protein [Microbacterium marinilacus]